MQPSQVEIEQDADNPDESLEKTKADLDSSESGGSSDNHRLEMYAA